MRDALSTEQWEYLRSVGVQPPPDVAREAAAPSPAPSSVFPAPASKPRPKWQWFLAILVIVAAICFLLAATVVRAETLTAGQNFHGAATPSQNGSLGQEPESIGFGTEDKLLDQLETQLSNLQRELRYPLSRSQLARIQAQVQGLRTLIAAMKGESQATRNAFSDAIDSVTARLEGEIHAAEVAHEESSAKAAIENQRLQAANSALQVALERQQSDQRRDNLILGGGLLLAMAWLTTIQFRRPSAMGLHGSLRKQLTQLSFFDCVSDALDRSSSTSKGGTPESAGASQGEAPQFSESGLAAPWTMGLASIAGNVRSENQDYGLCLRAVGYEVLIIADGLGGVPHGSAASRCAALGAAEAIHGALRTIGSEAQSLQAVAAEAMEAAGKALRAEGEKRHITTIADGLRTTLIVVIADAREIGFSYIGDGGGVVIGPDGQTRPFLKPQKVAANLLQASLGPVVQGEPVCGTLARQKGDLVIVGTDGVFDAVAEAFTQEVIRTAGENQGDLQRTAEQILQELASFRDEVGYVCDDNMTLGLMGGTFAPSSSGECAPPVYPDDVVTFESRKR